MGNITHLQVRKSTVQTQGIKVLLSQWTVSLVTADDRSIIFLIDLCGNAWVNIHTTTPKYYIYKYISYGLPPNHQNLSICLFVFVLMNKEKPG